jgi:predicted transcriptional regulator
VHLRIGTAAELAYTTVGTVLDRLLLKGLVTRERAGRGYVYAAAVERAEIDGARIGAVLSPMGVRPAVATLVDALEAIDPTLLDEIEREIQDRVRRGS